MPRIKHIPALPTELLRAHESGDLVLFCGSGISIPAGLPNYGGLVDSVYEHLHETHQPPESQAYKSEEYDRVLHYLEQRVGSKNVRRAVRLRLQAHRSNTQTHESILRLAGAPDGKLRLVTTNFDNLFQEAHQRLHAGHGSSLPIEEAPSLGVPKKDRWNSLVYLHGRLNDPRYPDDRHLVLTSGDFGRAYLTERWASRFVTGLLRDYVVLFVGYSASDPVMRYVLDAFAADELAESRLYAFASFKSAKAKTAVVESWKEKGVECIGYLALGENHWRLSRILSDWSNAVADGLRSRAQIVIDNVRALPSTLSPDTRQYVLWALDDPTGKAAKKLIDRTSSPGTSLASFEWLDVLEQKGYLATHADSSEGTACPLVAAGPTTTSPISLDRRTWRFAEWIASFLAVPETQEAECEQLLAWIIRRGAAVHPQLCFLLRKQLPEEPDAPHLVAWRLLLDPSVNSALLPWGDPREVRQLTRAIQEGEVPSGLETRVGRLLEPFVSFSRPLSLAGLWPDMEGEERLPVPSDYFSAAVTFRADDHAAAELMHAIAAANDPKIIGQVWPVLQAHLSKALRLIQLAYAVPEYVQRIDPRQLDVGTQALSTDHWKNLAFLVWRCFEQLDEADWPAARAIYLGWLDSPFVLTRNMALVASTTAVNLTTAQRRLALLHERDKWLWNPFVEECLLPCIRSLGGRLTRAQLAALTQRVLDGPPPDRFPS